VGRTPDSYRDQRSVRYSAIARVQNFRLFLSYRQFMTTQQRIVLFFLFSLLQSCSNNQIKEKNKYIDKKFSAWWADTYWEFYFNKDGTFKRNSMGHYGNTEVNGNYKMKLDTIHIISGFKNTDGTVNEYYPLDNDSFLVDLVMLYDYKSQKRTDTSMSTYSSRVRNEYYTTKNRK
jgi:hypothetical protein